MSFRKAYSMNLTLVLLALSVVLMILGSGQSRAASYMFLSVADTEVRADIPSVTFGTARVLGLDGSPARAAYLRFNVNVPAGQVVTKATLRLFMTSTSSTGVTVRRVASTSWSESTTSYANAPGIGSQIAHSGRLTANTYRSIDVTPLIKGSGLVSMAVTRSNTVPLGFRSREAEAHRPILIVETSTGSSSGALPIGSANYPVPAGALFASPSGNDSAAGTLAAPVRTIQRAINMAQSGRTIVIRAGVYHESISVPSNKTLTLQAYPGEAVWLDGSSAVTGWVRSGSTWVKSGWTPAFDSTPGFGGSPNWSFINSAYPMASHPDQVWIDGTPLAQVGAASQVRAGKFYVDYGADRLVIGSDPSGRRVTASDLSEGVLISSAGSKLLGIGIRNYATPSVKVGTLRIGAANVTLENVVARSNANVGILIGKGNARLNRVTTEDNGMLGIAANEADNIALTNVLSQRNNTENYNMSPVSGGIKITRTRGIMLSGSTLTNNVGNGLWIDESSYNARIFNNRMVNNKRHGLSYEISSLALIADNVVTGNLGTGMKINDATNIRIYNNTIGNNARNVEIVQDHRRASDMSIPGHDMRQPQPDPTVTWLLGNVQFRNNLVTPATAQYASYIRDYSGQRSVAQMNITLNGNHYHAQSPLQMMVWGITPTTPAVYATAAAFEQATGQGPGNGDSASTTLPIALPLDIATLIGQITGIRHVGAFQ